MPTDTIDIRPGLKHLRAGRLKDAEGVFREALVASPDDARALHMLAQVCQDSGRHEEAIGLMRRALQQHPRRAEFHNDLGTMLARQHRESEAIAAFEKAIGLRPEYVEALTNLCTALVETGKIDAAAEAGRKAVAARPDYSRAYTVLSAALRRQGRTAEAVEVQKMGTAIGLNYPEAYNELAAGLEQQGRLKEAIAAYRRAVELAPGDAAIHSNLLFTLCYDPSMGPHELHAEHLEWARRHAEPLAGEIGPHENDRAPGRRLRVGYVSADFREHTRALFMEPVLAAHDKAGFEVFCYSDVKRADDTTARIRAAADVWRETLQLPDSDLAALIRRDRIDILVELTGHMGNSRLLVFARKPAPVQAAYPGYPNSTGLKTIDYCITDAARDPAGCTGLAACRAAEASCLCSEAKDDGPQAGRPGHENAISPSSGTPGPDRAQKLYSEQLVRLPVTSQCYRPSADSPDVGPSPALLRGYVTFCCFNKLVKVSPGMMRAWAAILSAVPGSRLVAMAASAGREDEDVRRAFVSCGVPAERLELVRPIPRRQYLWRYNQVDIALDTFPYNGHTTTLDGLWMGVPAVTLAGIAHVAREGAALLWLLGLPQLMAKSPKEYVEAAVKLATDLPRLQSLRQGLRKRMADSPLMDAPRLTRELESAYRRMWAGWCETPGA